MKRSAQRAPTTKRRSHGTGTLYHDFRRDRWVGAVTIAGRRHKVVARTKTDASARLARLVAARTTGTPVDDRSYTVAQAVDVFLSRELPSCRRHGGPLAPATITGYRWACDIIVSRLGKVRLANLTAEDVEALDDELAARNGGPDSVASLRKIRTTLQQVIDVAVRRHKVTHNVATVATIPHDAEPAKPRRALDPAAARKLLAALRDEHNGAMFALSLRVGLRPGEAAGLWWDDLDCNVLHVQRRPAGRAAGASRWSTTSRPRRHAARSSCRSRWSTGSPSIAASRSPSVSAAASGATSAWCSPRPAVACCRRRTFVASSRRSVGVPASPSFVQTSYGTVAPHCSPTSASPTRGSPTFSATPRQGWSTRPIDIGSARWSMSPLRRIGRGQEGKPRRLSSWR